MDTSLATVQTLLATGSLIGALYTIALVGAFRWLGSWGGITMTAVALVGWGASLVAHSGGRYQAASWPLQVDLVILIVAVSTLPALAIHRARNRSPGTYLRQTVYGLGGFYLAVLGSLLAGVVLLLAEHLSGQ